MFKQNMRRSLSIRICHMISVFVIDIPDPCSTHPTGVELLTVNKSKHDIAPNINNVCRDPSEIYLLHTIS